MHFVFFLYFSSSHLKLCSKWNLFYFILFFDVRNEIIVFGFALVQIAGLLYRLYKLIQNAIFFVY